MYICPPIESWMCVFLPNTSCKAPLGPEQLACQQGNHHSRPAHKLTRVNHRALEGPLAGNTSPRGEQDPSIMGPCRPGFWFRLFSLWDAGYVILREDEQTIEIPMKRASQWYVGLLQSKPWW